MFFPVSNEMLMPMQAPMFRPAFDPMEALFMADPQEVSMELKNVVEFGWGFAKEFAVENKLSEVVTCVNDAASLEAEVDEIIADIKKMEPASIFDAAKKIVALLQGLPEELQTCKDMKTDFTKIDAWLINVLKHPQAVISHVIKNIGDITKTIPKMIDDLNVDDAKHAGKDLAHLVIDMFGTVDTEFSEEIDFKLNALF